ncbi:hypothetical protein [Accumulibacter sp.]|uniref:hypothetical protein n=1 Tax=Accumulibacter sp. TaxID=2053492 RepID=UPI002612ABDE|nr:hypothetical protein [Accumulibacter sp.]
MSRRSGRLAAGGDTQCLIRDKIRHLSFGFGGSSYVAQDEDASAAPCFGRWRRDARGGGWRLREAGRYREAIEHYKNPLKRERRPEWVDGLAASYADRSGELADKGMLPEALTVWRNRSTLHNRPLNEVPYLDWLLRAGEHDAALRLLSGTGDFPAPVDADLEMHLAAVALTAPDSALAQLAADSPLRRRWQPSPPAAGAMRLRSKSNCGPFPFARRIAICAWFSMSFFRNFVFQG